MGAPLIKKSPYFDYHESWITSDDDRDQNEEDEQVEEEAQNGNEEKEEGKHNGLTTYTNINCSAVFDRDAGHGNITMISRHLGWEAAHDFSTQTQGLGGGRALFVSMDFSKSVPAPYEEVEEDAIYFMDTGDVFNIKSGTSNPSKICDDFGKTWLFPSDGAFVPM
ncbi:hypothetical protein D1007_52892 [Hordeum vulgare]|nr:hypothetical protein D1007_52892 [Hordeum vulgare]